MVELAPALVEFFPDNGPPMFDVPDVDVPVMVVVRLKPACLAQSLVDIPTGQQYPPTGAQIDPALQNPPSVQHVCPCVGLKQNEVELPHWMDPTPKICLQVKGAALL
jgi:hypothetical protein